MPGNVDGGTGLHSLVALKTTLVILLCLTSKGYTLISQGDDTEKGTGAILSDNLHNSNTEVETGYLVNSPSCQIPDIPPFHESIKRLYEKQNEVTCSSKPMLTSVTRTEYGHVLHLHKKYFRWYSKRRRTRCYYQRIDRGDEDSVLFGSTIDNTVKYGEFMEFHGNVTFNQDIEFIHVTCVVRRHKVKNVYTNMHAFVGMKPQVARKMREADQKVQKERETHLSVMILGIDSISRLNMIRTMPKTVEYLEKNGWISLKGYNKVEDNTFPNLMAILTGMNMQQLGKSCFSRQTPLDSCPLLWTNFSQQGYITAYAEDEPKISSFNYHKAGFKESPTDYYLRPFMLAAQESTKHKSHSGLTICLGPVSVTNHILNYSLDFATSFSKYPSFSLFWLNGFSHNDMNTPTTMDNHVRSYFKSLKDTGALNTTMVLFLSDHGIRFGKIRETYIGYLEERLPFIYFWLPEWFKTAYPTKAENLVKNTNRLTSPFDVHMTLADVLGVQKVADGCPKCVSLFKEVPSDRCCMDAGIADHWCTCEQHVEVSNDSVPVQEISRAVVDNINAVLLNHTADLQMGWHCSELELKEVLSVRTKVFIKPQDYREFLVVIKTVPNDALFEATVVQNNSCIKVDGISRINLYRGQAQCMHESGARKYCYCQNSASTETPTLLNMSSVT